MLLRPNTYLQPATIRKQLWYTGVTGQFAEKNFTFRTFRRAYNSVQRILEKVQFELEGKLSHRRQKFSQLSSIVSTKISQLFQVKSHVSTVLTLQKYRKDIQQLKTLQMKNIKKYHRNS